MAKSSSPGHEPTTLNAEGDGATRRSRTSLIQRLGGEHVHVRGPGEEGSAETDRHLATLEPRGATGSRGRRGSRWFYHLSRDGLHYLRQPEHAWLYWGQRSRRQRSSFHRGSYLHVSRSRADDDSDGVVHQQGVRD